MKKITLTAMLFILLGLQLFHPADNKKHLNYEIYELKTNFRKDINLNKFYSVYQIYKFVFFNCGLIDRLSIFEKKDIISRVLEILKRNNLAELAFFKYQGRNDLVIKISNNFRFSTDEANIETNRIIFLTNYDKQKNKIISNKGITFAGNSYASLYYLIDDKMIYYKYAPVTLEKENDFNFTEVQEKADYYLLNEKDDDDILAFNLLNGELNNTSLDKSKRFVYNYYLILYHMKNNSPDMIKDLASENDLLINDLKDPINSAENKMMKEFVDIYSSL